MTLFSDLPDAMNRMLLDEGKEPEGCSFQKTHQGSKVERILRMQRMLRIDCCRDEPQSPELRLQPEYFCWFSTVQSFVIDARFRVVEAKSFRARAADIL